MGFRVAFLTIGQSPRNDIVPDILAEISVELSATEYGALDGLDDATIAAMKRQAGQECLVTRLHNGEEILLAKSAIEERLRTLIFELDTRGYDALVLLCTADFGQFESKTPMIEPQHVIDHFVQALVYGNRRIGVVLPSQEQIPSFPGVGHLPTKLHSVSPYNSDLDTALREAGEVLAETDIILMHCMGYTETMRRILKSAANRPVLLSRGLVVNAMELLLKG